MAVLNRIKAVLAHKRMSAAQLIPLLNDCPSEACMSFISQGYAMMTKRDLRIACEVLDVNPSDIYKQKDIDYSSLVTQPKIARTSDRDRSGRIYLDSGSEEAKEQLAQMIDELGMNGWQGWYHVMLGVTMQFHSDLVKMKEKANEGL